MVNVVSIVTLVFFVNHYKRLKENDDSEFSIARLIQNSGSRGWFFYLLTVIGITLFYGFFYFSDTTVVNDDNSLKMLLNTTGFYGDFHYAHWLNELIWYVLIFVPLILISVNIISEKLGKFNLTSIARRNTNTNKIQLYICEVVLLHRALLCVIQLTRRTL